MTDHATRTMRFFHPRRTDMRPSNPRATSRSLAPAIALATFITTTSANVAAEPEAHQTPAQLVDALHSAFGTHHARAVHAKGVVLEGTFVPTPDAQSLTRAALFTDGAVPITVRFSDFTGIPNIPDTSADANPRGLAVKFHGKDGSETDVVTHSFNGFPTADADEFAVFLRAIGASGPGVAKPTPIERFLAAHPVAMAFVTSQKPPPESYATACYFGVNAFRFVDARGRASFVRYRFMPQAGEHYLDAATLAGKGPDYLVDEIPLRTARAPVRFDWYAQVAEAGDPIEDPSRAWPDGRRLVKLGTLTIERAAADQAAAGRALLFLPSRVPPGIEPADPMIALRQAAYPISFGARQ
jgi:catalase